MCVDSYGYKIKVDFCVKNVVLVLLLPEVLPRDLRQEDRGCAGPVKHEVLFLIQP